MRARLLLVPVLVVAALLPAAPARAADETRHHLVDAQHTSAVPDSPLQPPLRLRWQQDLGTPMTPVLVTGGRVFYVRQPGTGLQLTALDVASGAVVWSQPVASNYRGIGLAADGGRLFVVTSVDDTYQYDVRVRALDQASGAQLWQRDLPHEYGPGSQPTADNGQLFLIGSSGSSYLHALRQSDGGDLWPAKAITSGDDSAPTVDASTVYVSVAGAQTFAFDRSTGTQRWHYRGCCTGGGGTTTRLHQGRLYGHDALVHDAGTGNVVGSWNGQPAFSGDGGVELTGPGLRGFGPGYGTTRWQVGTGYGFINAAPLIAGAHAYSANENEELFALRVADGATTWCQAMQLPPGSETSGRVAPLAAGNGVLVASVGYGLAAFESGGTSTGCAGPVPSSTATTQPAGTSGTAGSSLPVPPASSTGAPAVTLALGRTKLLLGERTNAVARVSGLPEPGRRQIALELDEWPFDGRWRVAARGTTLADGTAPFKLEPRRNVAVRARLVGPEKLVSGTAQVFADFPVVVRKRGAGGPRPRLVVKVLAFPRAQIRRRKVVAYLTRGRTAPWRRVDARRWQVLGKRSATVALRYPRGRLTKADRWLVCTREPEPDAFGRPSELERRCGARTLPRGLS